MSRPPAKSDTVPASAGIGLRSPHVAAFLAGSPPVPWLEVHSENYFQPGGPALAALLDIRGRYPISLHGVGLSLGSADGCSPTHLDHLQSLCKRIEPAMVSEHLCWGAVDGLHLNDLLPLPLTPATLVHLCAGVDRLQTRLQRPVLIENISAYITFACSVIPEEEFLTELVARTGCGLLLDVNNLYVNATNHGLDPVAYLDGLPRSAVGEIHLAGHIRDRYEGHEVLVDTHSRTVCPDVWALYARALGRFGPVPTLIEWDTDVPPLDTLLGEAATAQQLLAMEPDDVRAA